MIRLLVVNFKQVASSKVIAIETFHQSGFKLYKWYSNFSALKGKRTNKWEWSNFSKGIGQQWDVELNETKMLGLSWRKDKDLQAVEIPSEVKKLTKRTILQRLTSIYDPFRIISSATITGKTICPVTCDSKVSWDKPLAYWVVKKW